MMQLHSWTVQNFPQIEYYSQYKYNKNSSLPICAPNESHHQFGFYLNGVLVLYVSLSHPGIGSILHLFLLMLDIE